MNKEKIKGIWNEAVGETKEHIGRAIGNKDMEQKGHEQEMMGKVQKNRADALDAFKTDEKDKADDDNNPTPPLGSSAF